MPLPKLPGPLLEFVEAWARKGPFSLPVGCNELRTRPMFAIPFAINLGSVAVISRRCGILLSCNQRAHGPPMFAIPTPDVCRSLQLRARCRRRQTDVRRLAADGPPQGAIAAQVGISRASVQLAALKKAGCKTPVFKDELTGAHVNRPALARCLKILQPGDTLIVWSLTG